jgi:hypothetical protein
MLNKVYWHTVVRATLGYGAVLACLWFLIGFTAWSGLVFGWDRPLAILFIGGFGFIVCSALAGLALHTASTDRARAAGFLTASGISLTVLVLSLLWLTTLLPSWRMKRLLKVLRAGQEVDMSWSRVRMFIYAVTVVITIAWIIESCTVGRGFGSTYLAPVAIIGNLVLAFGLIRDDKNRRGRER